MDLINVSILHKTWGYGKIICFEEKRLCVQFDNVPNGKDTNIFSFEYPAAFSRGFLRVVDNEELQQEIINEADTIEMLKKQQVEKVAEVVRPTVSIKKQINKQTKKHYERENIAFKCNYCDGGASASQIGFAGVCSKAIIEYNINEAKRTWCSSEQCECYRFLNGEFTYNELCAIEEFLCY